MKYEQILSNYTQMCQCANYCKIPVDHVQERHCIMMNKQIATNIAGGIGAGWGIVVGAIGV